MKRAKNYILLAVLIGLGGVCVRYFSARFSFLRWDNFGFYVPSITAAQKLLWKGYLPVWNSYQHLGEPTLALGQFGVLYPGYILAFGCLKLFGIGVADFPTVVILLHVIFCAWGFYSLFCFLGLSSFAAFVGALASATCGMALASAEFWIFTYATFSWVPWLLRWGLALCVAPPSPRAAALFVFCVAGLLSIGHAQYCAYQLLFCVGTLALFLAFSGLPRRRVVVLAFALACGVLLAMPAIFPMLANLKNTARNQSYDVDYFARKWMMGWPALYGLLSPLLRADMGLWTRLSVMMYPGAIGLPALLGGIVSFRVPEPFRPVDAPGLDQRLLKVFCGACAAITLLFLLFSLGDNGLIYRWTHFIPVWSSFRSPAKMALTFSAGYVILCAIGFEFFLRGLVGESRRVKKSLYLILGGSALLAFLPGMNARDFIYSSRALEATWVLTTIVPVVMMLGFCRSGRVLLVGFLFASIIAISVVIQEDPDIKFYNERYASIDAAALGIDPAYRTLPFALEPVVEPAGRLQELTAAQVPTMTGSFRGATGSTTVLQPLIYLEWLPSDSFGYLPGKVQRELAGSWLLRDYNVGYLVAPISDHTAIRFLDGLSSARRLKVLPQSVVFELDHKQPRVFFATAVRDYSADSLREGLIANQATPTTAYVQWRAAESGPFAQAGTVRDVRWREDGSRAEIDVDAAQGGFLVVSEAYDPNWRVLVDGAASEVLRTDGAICGISLPLGARQVTLFYGRKNNYIGLALAAAGLLLLGLFSIARIRFGTRFPFFS